MISPADSPLGWVMVVLQLAMMVQILRLELKINAKIATQQTEIEVIKTKLKTS